MKIKKWGGAGGWGTWLAQWVEEKTLDLGVVSPNPILDREINFC